MPAEESFRPCLRGGPRAVVWLCFLSSLTVVAVLGTVSWPHAKAWVYEKRIREGTNPEGNLDAIAMLPSAAAVPILERYAQKPQPGIHPEHALSLLLSYHPESRFARGMRDYSAATGKGDYYLWGTGWWEYGYDRRQPFQAKASLPRLRDWLAHYPDLPGRDDACLRIAICLCDTDPPEALKMLYRGYHEPDGDKRHLIANWFQCVLERCATAEQLIAWLDADCPASVRGNVSYVAAVKCLRERRFAESLSLFEQWKRIGDGEITELPWSEIMSEEEAPSTAAKRKNSIESQIASCESIAHELQAAAEAADTESKAARLHAVARRYFHEDGMLRNHFYYRCREIDSITRTTSRYDAQGRWIGTAARIEELHLANHYRQAAEIFLQISRECPSYTQIESVDYSIPLCLWRVFSRRRQYLGSDINLALSQGFQAFADKYPRSTMADEALYQAGVHHYWAYQQSDSSVIRRSMAKIVREHPEGDVLAAYVTQNAFLQSAVVQLKFADFHLQARSPAPAEPEGSEGEVNSVDE